MEITIDIDDPVPLFAQLVAEIKRAVQERAVKPGDALPSIRQLARDLELNNKTIAKAYRLLERDKVIQTRGHRGTFVHPEAAQNSQLDLSPEVSAKLAETVATLRALGATDSEIRIAFAGVMTRQ